MGTSCCEVQTEGPADGQQLHLMPKLCHDGSIKLESGQTHAILIFLTQGSKSFLDLLVLWGKWSKFVTRPYSS